MRPLNDPAPSRLRYRLARLWRRRAVRRFALAQGPALALGATLVSLAADPEVHALVAERAAALREALTARPQFAIRRLVVEGAPGEVEAEIRAALADALGASSLAVDAALIRRRIEDLGWVAEARVSLEAPETLSVAVSPRRAVAVWRVDGEPALVDREGVVIAPAFSRADYPELPLIVGVGAERAVEEALEVLGAAGALGPRIRGLVRVGDRRWDVALDHALLMLPAAAPVAAMRAAVALQETAAVFDREIAALDLRLPEKPTLRLTEPGREAVRLRRETAGRKGRDA